MAVTKAEPLSASSSSSTTKATSKVGKSKYEAILQAVPNRVLVIIPLILPFYLLLFRIILENPTNRIRDSRHIFGYIVISILGYIMTQQLIPHISLYTLRKNIYGKDLGKRNTSTADVPMYVFLCLYGAIEIVNCEPIAEFHIYSNLFC